MKRLEQFPEELLEYVAKTIADWKSGTEITEFFRVAGYPNIRHDGSTKWRFVYAALLELNSSHDGPYHVAKIVEKIVDPKQHMGADDARLKLINSLNEALMHIHIQLNKDGRIVVTERPIRYQMPSTGAPTDEENRRTACRSIPTDIRRQLLVEAGHRCAITTCRAVSPLEAHHITPWAERQIHDPTEMLILCSNCHGRAHKGDIDRKALHRYKEQLKDLAAVGAAHGIREGGASDARDDPAAQQTRIAGTTEDWSEERDRPRFEVTQAGVSRLETNFAPQFNVRQFSGDPIANLEWRFRGPRFPMEWRQASGSALSRTHFLNEFDLSKQPQADDLVGLDELGFEIRFHWRGRWRSEIHRWPITRRELPAKVLFDVGGELLPPLEADAR